jgi:uncharacterized protein YjbJ (UPF0337 family)
LDYAEEAEQQEQKHWLFMFERRRSPDRADLLLDHSPPGKDTSLFYLCIAAELSRRRPVYISTTQKENIMNEHRDNPGVDSDRTEGSIKKMGGNVKEGAGNLLGDEKMKREGQSDQAEGKLQNAWGGVKDSVRDALGTDKK